MRIYLPQCTQTVVHYCIETLAISPSSEAPLQAGSLLGYTTARTYPEDVTRGIPESATTSRWKVPGVLNKAGTDTYAVKVLLDGFLSATSNSLYVSQVSALIEPYEEKSGSANTDSACTSWQSGTTCGVRKDFVEGQKAQLSVRLPKWNSVNAGNPASLEWVKQLAKPLNDRATGEHTTWSFSTIPSNRGNNKCFEDKTQLLGVVMTNSLVYAPSAPEFDGSQLNYQVGGLHFQPDGKTPNLGTYDLLIKSATARCLYNFTDAPLCATVSVTYADGGEQKIATTTLTEKNGWLHLGAYGFTFSSPVLRVKLSGVPKAIPKPTQKAEPAQQPRPTKNYTMTCVKGKITKKVIAPKPMCPTGWKKK